MVALSNGTPPSENYTLSLHDALPIWGGLRGSGDSVPADHGGGRPPAGLLLTEPIRGLADLTALLLAVPALLTAPRGDRSEEHTSELQSPVHLVCRLLLEKKNKTVK